MALSTTVQQSGICDIAFLRVEAINATPHSAKLSSTYLYLNVVLLRQYAEKNKSSANQLRLTGC